MRRYLRAGVVCWVLLVGWAPSHATERNQPMEQAQQLVQSLVEPLEHWEQGF